MSARPLVVMPDAVAVTVGYLRHALAAAGAPVPVVSRIPNPRPKKFVRVRRVGGLRETPVSDRPASTSTRGETPKETHTTCAPWCAPWSA